MNIKYFDKPTGFLVYYMVLHKVGGDREARRFVVENGFGADGLSVDVHTLMGITLCPFMISTLLTVITLFSTKSADSTKVRFRQYLETAPDIEGLFSTHLASLIVDALTRHVGVAVDKIVVGTGRREFHPVRVAQDILIDVFDGDLHIERRPRQTPFVVDRTTMYAHMTFIDTEPCVMPEEHIAQFQSTRLTAALGVADRCGGRPTSPIDIVSLTVTDLPRNMVWTKATKKTYIATDPDDHSLWRREVCHTREDACFCIRGLIFQRYIHNKTKLTPQISLIAVSRCSIGDIDDAVYVYAKTTKMLSRAHTFFQGISEHNLEQLIGRIALIHSTICSACRLIVCDTASKNCVYP